MPAPTPSPKPYGAPRLPTAWTLLIVAAFALVCVLSLVFRVGPSLFGLFTMLFVFAVLVIFSFNRRTSSPVAAKPAKQYGAPRRYSISTLFAVTTAFAVLFSVLAGLGAPPTVVLHIGIFLTIIGMAQMVLFRGRDPRAASVLTGAVVVPIYAGIRWIPQVMIGDIWSLFSSEAAVGLLAGFSLSLLFGMICGYLGGLLVGGVFLITENLQHTWSGKSPEDVDSIEAELIVAELVEPTGSDREP